MKKNQVNAMFVDQTRRRKTIISYCSLIFIITFMILSFMILFFNKNKVYYVSYNEDSKIDYKVYLKDNEFFEKTWLDANNQYIANLIDYIDTRFNYKLNIDEENIAYKYRYSIKAKVNVMDKDTNNSIYTYEDVLVGDTVNYANDTTDVLITKDIKIDYNKYNNLIKRFVSVYNLEDAKATLDIVMDVQVLGDCEQLENADTISSVSLSMPLTTKTVNIDIAKSLVDNDKEKFMACKDSSFVVYIYLVIAIILLMIDIVFIVKMTRYIIKTRTAINIYQRELKRILNNYKSYIQKINNSFDLSGYQALQVDDFTDMLEIRDTLGQPILMTENRDKTGVYFIIPSNTKILYTYSLKVSSIEKKMKENTIRDN